MTEKFFEMALLSRLSPSLNATKRSPIRRDQKSQVWGLGTKRPNLQNKKSPSASPTPPLKRGTVFFQKKLQKK
jgi:hypothetical protein